MEPGSGPVTSMKGAKAMEFLIPQGVVVAWVVLQAWVLPRFGVKT
jgi:hypothetical protein